MARLSRLATETNATPFDRQAAVGGELGLGERRAERRVDAHHLAGGAHLGAEHVVDTASLDGAEPLEREHGLLDRDRPVDRQLAAVAGGGQQALGPQVGDARAEHHPRGRLCQWHAGGLGDERNRARRPRVGLEHVEDVGGQRELHVEQAADAHPLGQGEGARAHPRDLLATQGHRRQHARRVARVDAGLLDVLHHATEEEVGAVVEGVDVDLDGVVEEPVDEDRALGRDLGGLGHVGRELPLVVHDLHAAAAEHVGRADEHRDSRSPPRSAGRRRRTSRCRAWARPARHRPAPRRTRRGPRRGGWPRGWCRRSARPRP